MILRRPLFLITIFYTLGIAGAYLLYGSKLSTIIFFSSCGIFLVCISRPCHSRSPCHSRAGGNLIPFRLAVICLFALVIGALNSGHQVAIVDPLEAEAVSYYNNVENIDQASNSGTVNVSGRVISYKASKSGTVSLIIARDNNVGHILVTVKAIYSHGFGQDGEPRYAAQEVMGKRVSLSGIARIPSGARNPGGFDYRQHLLSKNIRVIVETESLDLASSAERSNKADKTITKFLSSVYTAKYDFLDKAKEQMDADPYALFSGLLFGDKSSMDDDMYATFQHNGVAHTLSVSGLHVGIVYAFIVLLFRGLRSVPACIATIILLLLYALLSEFTPSVMRAVTIIIVHIFARLTHRKYDFLTGISAAALIMLVIHPLQLFSLGFQLSFLAVLCIAFIMPATSRFTAFFDTRTKMEISTRHLESHAAISRIKRNIAVPLLKAFIFFTVVQICMIPISAFSFNYVSISAFIINPIVITLCSILLPLCVGFFVISLLLSPLASMPQVGGILDAISTTTGKTCEFLCSSIINTVKFADTLPLSHFNVVSPPRIVLCAIYIIALFASSEMFRIMRNRATGRSHSRVIAGTNRVTSGLTRNLVLCLCFFLATLFTVSTSTAVPFYHYNPTLAFVDIGQGDCLHIRTPDGKNYLIDSGGSDNYNVGENILKPYLLKNGISHLDGVFVTHLHTDHFKGITELAQEMPIGPIFVYSGSDPFETEWADALTAAGITKEDIIGISAGDSVSLDSSVNILVLYPPALAPSTKAEYVSSDSVDENLNSLIMKVNYDGATAMMTGDIGFPGEESLLDSPYKNALHADVLKVAHHGSKYSTSDEFLTAVNPMYAVIQSGRNTYGHPTAEILEMLSAYGTITFREDLSGMIDFKIVNGKITQVTEWQQHGIRKKKLTVSN